MADVNPRRQLDITSSPDTLFGLAEAPASVRYLASFAMTAFATVVAVGVDSQVAIPNISLIFVVPVIVGAVGLILQLRISASFVVTDGGRGLMSSSP